MRYAYVKGGQIIEGPTILPSSWRNISGLNNLSDDELLPLGWLPWRFIETQGDVFNGSTIEITPTEIVETQKWRAKTQDDIAHEAAEQGRVVRAERNARLAASDWTQLADAPINSVAWANYRQALRDVPAQTGFPWQITWPVPPA